MNLLLLSASDMQPDGTARIVGRRFQHLQDILQLHPGEAILAGEINGNFGHAEILERGDDYAVLRPRFERAPPQPLPVTLVLALPRPKMLKRVLQTAATMGVKRIYLINSYKVEKSYWSSPWLKPEKIEENLILGLEQGVDTILPQVHLRQRFKPFVEDELPAIAEGSQALVAHPTAATRCPIAMQGAVTLAIGPEGGFIPYEVEKLLACGFNSVSLGSRILRVETALPALLARLHPA